MLKQKIGVLGGGQLGKMLCQDASKLGIRLHILEKDDSFPAAGVCPDITSGDFTDYDDVYAFGQQMDIITVEIEAVNTAALHRLVAEGKKVFPQPHVLDTIRDKGLQKQFYAEHDIPTSPFQLFESADAVRAAVANDAWKIPFVQKTRTDGYDGQGVKVVRTEADLQGLLDAPCLLESLVAIQKELAVIVARTEAGDMETFPVVEMEFHPTANLVEYLFAPSDTSADIQAQATALSRQVAEQLGIVGLLAVELFLTADGTLLINEVAPRPHNSGHQTIEGNITSQYEQHIRAIAGLPLGDTAATGASVMVNLLGAEGTTGPAHYHGMNECLAISGAHYHIYGKAVTKPWRKMGHATVVADTLAEAIEKAKQIKHTLDIRGHE